MNVGLIVGKVWKPDKDEGAPTGEVALYKIMGGKEVGFKGQKYQYAATELDSNGEFELPFAWSGTEFAEDLSVITMYLYASWSVFKNYQGFQTFAHARVTLRGYVVENMGCRIALALPDLQSYPGLLAFGKSLIEAYRNIKGIPIPSVDWTSAECKLMLSAGDIRLVASD